ncbi:MAG: hypothetical protein PUP92_39875, partial [Rhizonema sp. PD38]|nr:hypothetical protein [Rhizonema sp. PD38]
ASSIAAKLNYTRPFVDTDIRKECMDILVDNLFINSKKKDDSVPQGIPGYLIRSTARANVEDSQDIRRDDIYPSIQTVIDLLYTKSKKNTQDSNDLGVVIAIHGYNTGSADIDLTIEPESDDEIKDGVWKYWYQNVNKYINKDPVISQKSDSLVFLGYRWPSESVIGKNFSTSFSALPFLLNGLLWGSLIVGLISLVFFFWLSSPLFIFPIILGTFGFAFIFSLLMLRVIVYFRDSYRATNYGVNDLVELIRQIDQGLLECRMKDEQCNQEHTDDKEIAEAAKAYWKDNRVKLSFIGHSMGGYVTTQVVRILSDIFDPNSIGNFNNEKADKNPSPHIGRVFSLGRLILVSPDIPVLTITSGRSNFLRSSLRRFEEAYLFSNEGDLALRLASTAANYFSFPAKSRTQGYRLGNVTVRPKDKQSSKAQKQKGEPQSEYGIVNWKDKELCKPLLEMSSLLKYLEVSVLNQTHNQGLDPVNQEKPHGQDNKKTAGEMVATPIKDRESISDFFTYFDCTEYKDLTDYSQTDKEHYVMSLDKQISPLTFWEYLQLGWAYLAYSTGKPFDRNGRDVHGGYFWGQFSQKLMYRLAFVGFQEFLDSLSPEQTATDTLCSNSSSLSPDQAKRQMALNELSRIMERKQIQTVLSPERYFVDVMGQNREEVRKQILNKSCT